jgi:hypothetical protein
MGAPIAYRARFEGAYQCGSAVATWIVRSANGPSDRISDGPLGGRAEQLGQIAAIHDAEDFHPRPAPRRCPGAFE